MSNKVINVKPEPSQHKWWVYIIETAKGAYYTGITTDIARRWTEHSGEPSAHSKSKGAKYFRSQAPKEFVYLERGHDRSTASKREAEIKKLNRKDKIQLVAHGADETHHLKLLFKVDL